MTLVNAIARYCQHRPVGSTTNTLFMTRTLSCKSLPYNNNNNNNNKTNRFLERNVSTKPKQQVTLLDETNRCNNNNQNQNLNQIDSNKNNNINSCNHNNHSRKILVTGAFGQIGQELVPFLRSIHGEENVIASDIRVLPKEDFESSNSSSDNNSCPFRFLNVLNEKDLFQAVDEEGVSTIIHLAAILSANGEKDPLMALKINNEGTQNVLEAAKRYDLQVFCPSSIAVFGPSSPKYKTPDDTITQPITVYGITKLYAELLGEYYHKTYGVDFRSIRYPGVISTKSKPGGGTTDYAANIYRDATSQGRHRCYLQPNTAMPMMYMPDVLDGTVRLLEANSQNLSRRTYNIGSMSFTPEQIAASIRRYVPNFRMEYENRPDYRQVIADSWPCDVDYSVATADWGFVPKYDLERMTKDILDRYCLDGGMVHDEEYVVHSHI